MLGRVGKARSRQTREVLETFEKLRKDQCGQSTASKGSGKTEVGGAGLWVKL